MAVLALDPSLTCYGFSVIEKNEIASYGCIRTAKEKGQISVSDSSRIRQICDVLKTLVDNNQIDHVVFEDPAGSKSAVANKALALVKGATIGFCVASDIPFSFIRARDAKKKLCGNADATKEEIYQKVCEAFPTFEKTMEKKPKDLVEAVSDSVSVYLAITNTRGINI